MAAVRWAKVTGGLASTRLGPAPPLVAGGLPAGAWPLAVKLQSMPSPSDRLSPSMTTADPLLFIASPSCVEDVGSMAARTVHRPARHGRRIFGAGRKPGLSERVNATGRASRPGRRRL